MLDILRSFGIPAIVSVITAIIIKTFDRSQEKKAERNMRIFDNKRESFTRVLSLITNIIIHIKSQFSWEHDAYSVIAENDCDDFQVNVENQILYLSEKDILTIRFITELLNTNSSWIYNVASGDPNEFFGFDTKDLAVIEYLYNLLIRSFKDDLFGNKKKNDSIDEIYIFKISSLLKHLIVNKDFIDSTDKKCFYKFDYHENNIHDFIARCNEDKKELKSFCNKIVEIYKNRNDINSFDKKRIDDLSNYIKFIK
ncbi:hypothetical protein FACS189485_06540 [Spirochaetia bacterium]|nr:hypothetical protein FACS189485_06540 [Spirochaetia bacterium]